MRRAENKVTCFIHPRVPISPHTPVSFCDLALCMSTQFHVESTGKRSGTQCLLSRGWRPDRWKGRPARRLSSPLGLSPFYIGLPHTSACFSSSTLKVAGSPNSPVDRLQPLPVPAGVRAGCICVFVLGCVVCVCVFAHRNRCKQLQFTPTDLTHFPWLEWVLIAQRDSPLKIRGAYPSKSRIPPFKGDRHPLITSSLRDPVRLQTPPAASCSHCRGPLAQSSVWHREEMEASHQHSPFPGRPARRRFALETQFPLDKKWGGARGW